MVVPQIPEEAVPQILEKVVPLIPGDVDPQFLELAVPQAEPQFLPALPV